MEGRTLKKLGKTVKKKYIEIKFFSLYSVHNLPYCVLCDRTFLNSTMMPGVGSLRTNTQFKEKYFKQTGEKVVKSPKSLL